MGLFDFIFDEDKKEASSGIFSFLDLDKDQKSKQDITGDDLEEWQKDLVDEGVYDSTSFEEDGELEEDDYYSEEEE